MYHINRSPTQSRDFSRDVLNEFLRRVYLADTFVTARIRLVVNFTLIPPMCFTHFPNHFHYSVIERYNVNLIFRSKL